MKKSHKNSEFLNEVIENYPNIEIIDYNSDSVLGYNKKTNKVYYIYKVNEDMSFCFHLFCEIGQCYQPWFKYALKQNGYKVETRDTKEDYFEVLLPIE